VNGLAIGVLVAVTLLAGCAKQIDAPQAPPPPLRTTTVGGDSLKLASCVMEQIDRVQGEGGTRYQLLTAPTARSATIRGMSRGPTGMSRTGVGRLPEDLGSSSQPVLELSFRQRDDANVVIESRAQFPGSVLEPRVWPIVERCAGTPLTLVPPLG
jgi:hypothetical protein